MKRAKFAEREGDKFVHLRFAGDVAGFCENFLCGNCFASSSRVASSSFHAAQRTTFAPSRRKCPAMALPSPWLAAGDERVETFEFHIQARPTERCSTAGRFFNSFSKKRLASTKMRWCMAGTIFAQSADEIPATRCKHRGVASFTASAICATSRTLASSAGKCFTADQRREHPRLHQQIPAQFHRRAAAERVRVGGVSQAEHGDLPSRKSPSRDCNRRNAQPRCRSLLCLMAGMTEIFSFFAAASWVSATTSRASVPPANGPPGQIGLWPDARFAFQAGGNLLGVRANVLAQPRDLIDERDGKREK